MAFTDKPWDGDASRWPDTASYCDDCLINENTGDRKECVQAKCHLPYREPGSGDINKNALRNASSRIGQVQASSSAKARAASRLAALKKQAGIGE